MSRWLIQRNGQFAVVNSLSGEGDATVITNNVPEGFPDTLEWNGEAFVPRPPELNADEIFDLFTAEEKTAILTSGVPQVIGLVLGLRFLKGRIRPDDPFHTQGVALLAGLEFLTPERAARVLAMLPPEI